MYKLFLTEEDISTISFVGCRYSWSEKLSELCEEGENIFPEHISWEIKDAFESDAQGGHSFFPMLDCQSDLCEKLAQLYISIE
jgi:hypothetical protein